MTAEEFQEEIHTMIKRKKAADVTLAEEASRNWAEIVTREYLFDRHEKDIAILETLDSQETIREMSKRFTDDKSPEWKKLSVQILGNKSGTVSTGEEDDEENNDGEEVSSESSNITDAADPNGKFGYAYLPVAPGDKREFVTDVVEFSNSLKCYPAVKITK